MIYDFKSEKSVQEVVLDDIDELVENIDFEFNNLRRYETLSLYANYKEVVHILLDMCDGENIDILSSINNYSPNKMVILTLSFDGVLTVEEAYDEAGTVILSESVLTYVYDSACTCSMAEIIDKHEENVLHYSYERDWN